MVSRSPLDNSSLSLPALHRVLLLLARYSHRRTPRRPTAHCAGGAGKKTPAVKPGINHCRLGHCGENGRGWKQGLIGRSFSSVLRVPSALRGLKSGLALAVEQPWGMDAILIFPISPCRPALLLPRNGAMPPATALVPAATCMIETLSMSRALPSVVAHLTDLTSLPALFDHRLCNPAVKLVLEAPYLMVTIRWRNPPFPSQPAYFKLNRPLVYIPLHVYLPAILPLKWKTLQHSSQYYGRERLSRTTNFIAERERGGALELPIRVTAILASLANFKLHLHPLSLPPNTTTCAQRFGRLGRHEHPIAHHSDIHF